ncbi:MAG: hypothetical protein WBO48_15935, partial [Candidatus Promineifilaceae bacterium]
MRVFGLIMAFVTTTTLLNPRSGPLHFLLWLPKLLASALSPLVVAASWLPILVGRRRRDPLLVGLGITSTFLALRQLAAVTAPREAELVEAFGAD